MTTAELIRKFFEKIPQEPRYGEENYGKWKRLCEIVADRENIPTEGAGREKWSEVNSYIARVRREQEQEELLQWLESEEDEEV